ncbi:MAG TPA: STAS domain-containing protein [Thermoanaerobaculia bacterium]|nr:STAS domain-containing protein [Thermoanaerobaculia bacterium]
MLDIRVSADTIHLAGRFDSTMVDKADRVFSELVKSTTVDLAGLEYLSSAGIAVLVRAYKRLHSEGHELRLANPKEPIRQILRVAGLDRVFTIAPSSE